MGRSFLLMSDYFLQEISLAGKQGFFQHTPDSKLNYLGIIFYKNDPESIKPI